MDSPMRERAMNEALWDAICAAVNVALDEVEAAGMQLSSLTDFDESVSVHTQREQVLKDIR